MTPDQQFSDQKLADLYDLGNAGSEDRDFYLSLVGETPERILDLGCGTGLLCLAYAARGHDVTGLDPAAAMLNVARRAPGADRVNWIMGQAETFQSDARFDLIIMTGHAFQVLLTDDQVAATMRTMARYLAPGGRAVFESRNPNLDWDAIWVRDYTMPTDQGPVRAVRRMISTERAPDYLAFAWDYHFGEDVVTSDSTVRFMTHTQIIEAGSKAGLKLSELFGDWDRSPFDPITSREMIFQFEHKSAE